MNNIYLELNISEDELGELGSSIAGIIEDGEEEGISDSVLGLKIVDFLRDYYRVGA